MTPIGLPAPRPADNLQLHGPIIDGFHEKDDRDKGKIEPHRARFVEDQALYVGIFTKALSCAILFAGARQVKCRGIPHSRVAQLCGNGERMHMELRKQNDLGICRMILPQNLQHPAHL